MSLSGCTNSNAREYYRQTVQGRQIDPPTRDYTQTLLQDPTHNAFVSTLFTVWETHYHLRKQALLGLGLHQGLADALASEILIRRYRTNNAQYQTPAEFSAMQLSIAEHVLSRTKAVPVRSRTLDITSVTDPPGCGPSVFALWSDARNAGSFITRSRPSVRTLVTSSGRPAGAATPFQTLTRYSG